MLYSNDTLPDAMSIVYSRLYEKGGNFPPGTDFITTEDYKSDSGDSISKTLLSLGGMINIGDGKRRIRVDVFRCRW